jgi:DNA-3-methyladenine glycosylase II
MAERARFNVRPTRPYSLERTAARFLRFPEVVDHFQDGVYQRLFQVGRRLLLLSVRQLGPPSRALLEVRLAGKDAGASEARAAATRLLERSLGIHADIPAFYRACRNDPLLAKAIRRARGLSVAGFPDPWEALVTAVVSQQVNLALAYRIRRDLALRFGRRARIAGKTHIAFPRPERMAKETVARLRRLGLSRAKAETLLRLANGFRRGVLAEAELDSLPDEELIQRLTAIKGIGRWTAETALMRGLARSDAFPAGDLGVVKYVAQGLLGRDGLATEQEMRELAERWRPHRALALTYAYAELTRLREAEGESK